MTCSCWPKTEQKTRTGGLGRPWKRHQEKNAGDGDAQRRRAAAYVPRRYTELRRPHTRKSGQIGNVRPCWACKGQAAWWARWARWARWVDEGEGSRVHAWLDCGFPASPGASSRPAGQQPCMWAARLCTAAHRRQLCMHWPRPLRPRSCTQASHPRRSCGQSRSFAVPSRVALFS